MSSPLPAQVPLVAEACVEQSLRYKMSAGVDLCLCGILSSRSSETLVMRSRPFILTTKDA